MTTASAWIILTVSSGALACLLTAICRHVAEPLGMLDCPDGHRKTHGQPVPLLGGVAVCATIVCAWFFWNGNTPSLNQSEVGMMVSLALFCGAGVWDDRCRLRPAKKFLLQVLATLPFLVTLSPPVTLQFAGYEFPLVGLSFAFTLIWILGATNSVNLLDGADGLAACVGIVGAIGIAGLAFIRGHTELVPLCLILGGGLSGFLVHNWAPARVFLGDAGSLPLGFALGALTLRAAQGPHGSCELTTPLILLAVPICDTMAAILRRTLTGHGIAEADRAHLHHMLQSRGWNTAKTVLVIASISGTLTLSALVAAQVGHPVLGFVAVGLMLAISVRNRFFGHVETRLLQRRWNRILVTIRVLAGPRPPRSLLHSITEPELPTPPEALR